MPSAFQSKSITKSALQRVRAPSQVSTATGVSRAFHSAITPGTPTVPESWDDDLEEGEIRESRDTLGPLPTYKPGRLQSSVMTHKTFKSQVGTNPRLANLRGPRGRANGDHTTLAGSVADLRGRGRTNSTWEDYKLGDVVRVIHITPNNDRNAKFDDPTVSYNEITGPSQHKFRPGVVVGIFEHCLKILPMYSSQGNGLSRKPIGIREDCVMVNPKGVNESNAPPSFQGNSLESVVANMRVKDGSYIYFSQEYPVNYSSPIEIVGDLNKSMTSYVLSRYQLSLDKGLMNVLNHSKWQKEKLFSLKQKLMPRRPKAPQVDDDGFQSVPPNKRSRPS